MTGGVGVVLTGLARFQVEQGWRVCVAAPSSGPGRELLTAAGAQHLPWEATPRPGPRVAGELRALARMVHATDPDIVHLHSSKAGLAGRLAVRRRLPTVMQPHGWSFSARSGVLRRAARGWERAGARLADVIICVSGDERRLGQDAGIHARYVVAPNGVDLARFSAANEDARVRARRGLGLAAEPLAVCVARLHRQKNQSALLGVWPAVRTTVPGARLLLVGDGPDRDTLTRRASPGVQLIGAVDDPRPWLAAADVVVAPSRWEGMSLTVLEAMATARSVVATDVGGMRELLDGGAGAVVPPGDASLLAREVARRLCDHRLADAEGREGRRRVEARHDLAAQHARILRLYEDLLGARPRRATNRPRAAAR